MANVFNKITSVYLRSVNTPDYLPSEWIINPNLSNVSGIAQKYWKAVGESVVEMDAAEKDVVDYLDFLDFDLVGFFSASALGSST